MLQAVGDLSESLQATLLQRARDLSYPLRLIGVGAPFLERFAGFVAHFEVEENRDTANYIYLASDLAELKGGKFSKKRNLIAQANKEYSWTAEPLLPEHAEACLEVADDIAEHRKVGGGTLEQETRALEEALRLFGRLGLQGLLVRVRGKPAAFSIFECMGPQTAVVMFERAVRDYKGLYQVINQETAKVIAGLGYTFINREEDLGDPGLRKAKLSYQPTRLEMAYTLTLRR